MSDQEQTPEFTITRTLEAPRDLVWRAWTKPEHLVNWIHPHGVSTPPESISFDVRKGGQLTYTMIIDSTGDEYPAGGTFLEVDPPERLVFTWSQPVGPVESSPVATVTLTDKGDRTEMEFNLRGVGGEAGDNNVYDGWNEAFEILGAYVKKSATLLSQGSRVVSLRCWPPIACCLLFLSWWVWSPQPNRDPSGVSNNAEPLVIFTNSGACPVNSSTQVNDLPENQFQVVDLDIDPRTD